MACHVMSCHVMSCGMTRCHLIARQVCRLADYCVMSLIIRYAYNIIICTTVFYSLACRCSTCCFVNAMPCIYFVCVYSQSSWSGSSQLIKTFRSWYSGTSLYRGNIWPFNMRICWGVNPHMSDSLCGRGVRIVYQGIYIYIYIYTHIHIYTHTYICTFCKVRARLPRAEDDRRTGHLFIYL